MPIDMRIGPHGQDGVLLTGQPLVEQLLQAKWPILRGKRDVPQSKLTGAFAID